MSWLADGRCSEDAFSFSGLAVGHWVAGFLADLKGRRLPIVLGYLGISLLSLFMTMSSGYSSMVFLRILHGIACGIGVPPAMSMIAEIMPSDWRPFMFIIFWSFTAVGETYAAVGLVIFMPELKEESWKQADKQTWTNIKLSDLNVYPEEPKDRNLRLDFEHLSCVSKRCRKIER